MCVGIKILPPRLLPGLTEALMEGKNDLPHHSNAGLFTGEMILLLGSKLWLLSILIKVEMLTVAWGRMGDGGYTIRLPCFSELAPFATANPVTRTSS